MGGKLKTQNLIFPFLMQKKGCQKSGDDVQNVYTILRANHSSSERPPDWDELHTQLQHPRVDCGYFQLGKYKKFSLEFCLIMTYVLVVRTNEGFYLTQAFEGERERKQRSA